MYFLHKTFKDQVFVYLLIFPIVTRWLFLDTWETALTFSVIDYPLFLPELSFLFLPFFYTGKAVIYNRLVWFAIIGLGYNLFTCLINPISTPYLNFIGGSDFYLTTLIVALFPISSRHIKIIRWPFLIVLILIGLQIILFSLGILKYAGLEDRHQYGEIIRISTTVGAATGTSAIIFMLSAICYYCFNDQKYLQIFILVFGTITIAFTLSRGGILAQILFLSYLFYDHLKPFSTRKLKQIIGAMVTLVVIGYAVNERTHFLESVHERVTRSEESGDYSSGRFERWGSSYELFLQNPIFGNGSCYMNPYTRARTLDVDSIETFSPHNTFLLVLVDYGIIGILLLLSVFIFFWKIAFLKRKKNALNMAFLITLFILMNVEIVFLTMHYIFLFYLMAMLAQNDIRTKPLIFKHENKSLLFFNGKLKDVSTYFNMQ